ncbi:MAG TPA: PKD domain-containing protein [Candidatus Paceibacterota bacterium]
MFEKVVSASIGLVFLASPLFASALSADVQSKIDALLLQIKELQALIAELQGGTFSSCVDLSRNLTLGSTGDDVSDLQKYLDAKDYFSSKTTGYYGFITAQAVGKLQMDLGIVSSTDDTAYGLMGPRTRAAVACGTTPPPPPQPNTTFSATPTSGAAPLTVTFREDHNSPTIGFSDLMFDYGDGSTPCRANETCNKQLLTHTYIAPGTYTAKLTGMGENGRVVLGTATITVGPSSPSSGITLTAPNGGEQWEIGTMNTITWTPYGYNPDVNPPSDVTAYLEVADSTYAGGFRTVGRIVPSGKASIHWEGVIRSEANPSEHFAAPGKYYVLVLNNKTGGEDRSNAPFTLLPKAVDLKINGSDGPISVDTSQLVRASWTATNVERCELHNAYPDLSRQFQVGSVPSSGSRDVYLHQSFGPTLYCYKSDGSARYDSVQVNIGGTQASLQVTSPNGGEKINPAQEMVIKFSSTGLSSAAVALYKNDQWKYWINKDVQPSAKDLNSVSVLWTPSAALTGLGEGDNAGAIFKIYVTGQKTDGTGYIDDKSDAPFGFTSTYVLPVPTLEFSANPVYIASGQTTTLTWKSANATSCVVGDGAPATLANAVLAAGTSGSAVTPGLASTIIFSLTCTGSGGSVTKSVKITVGADSATVDQSGSTVYTPEFTLSGFAKSGVSLVQVIIAPSTHSLSATQPSLMDDASAGYLGVVANTSSVQNNRWQAYFGGLTGDRVLTTGINNLYVFNVSDCNLTVSRCDSAATLMTGTITVEN